MLCPGCGFVLQRGAAACVTVSCPEYGRPLTPEVQLANRPQHPGPTAPMRSLDRLANATIACVVVTAVSAAIAVPLGRLHGTTAAGVSWTTIPGLSVPLTGESTPGADPFAGLTRAWVVTDLVILGVGLIGAVLFGAWLFRARRNLDALPAANPFWAKSWSLGVWFIPAGNLAMPALVMEDVATQTVAADPDDPDHPRLILLSRTWWLAVVVMFFLLYVLARPAHPAPGLLIVAAVSILVAAAGCITFIRRLSALQTQRFQPDPARYLESTTST